MNGPAAFWIEALGQDGSYKREAGILGTARRDALINMLPKLASTFRSMIVYALPSLLDNIDTMRTYFNPLKAAFRAANMELIVGFYLDYAAFNCYGIDFTDDRVRGINDRHENVPACYADQAFWSTACAIVDRLAALRFRTVQIDAEWVAWRPFEQKLWWRATPLMENVAAGISQLTGQMIRSGVQPLWYKLGERCPNIPEYDEFAKRFMYLPGHVTRSHVGNAWVQMWPDQPLRMCDSGTYGNPRNWPGYSTTPEEFVDQIRTGAVPPEVACYFGSTDTVADAFAALAAKPAVKT